MGSPDYRPLIEHWNGQSWKIVVSPDVRGSLLSVAAVSPEDAWAVGWQYDQLGGLPALVEHWDGQSWSVVSGPGVPTQALGLTDVDAASPTKVWAVGYSYDSGGVFHTLIEQWNGDEWQLVSHPDPYGGGVSFSGVASLSARDAWAVGSASIVEHWNGRNWRIIPSPKFRHDTRLTGVTGISSDDVWAIGESGPNAAFGRLVEHWDGFSWHVVSFVHAASSLSGIDAVSPGQVWAVGELGDRAFPTATLTQLVCPIEVSDSGFAPSIAGVPMGEGAAWTFSPRNLEEHTVTDATGMELFDSGPSPPGGSFTFRFFAAGSYPVLDKSTLSRRTVVVPMKAHPSHGDPATDFTLRWASGPTPASFLYDVQILRPGSDNFVVWQAGVSVPSGIFIPDSGPGLYSFRARIRQGINGHSSDWSSPISIVVS